VSSFVKAFRAPKESLGDLKADVAATLVAAASDVALAIDSGVSPLDIAEEDGR
jgi:hypothetical protein